MFHWIMVDDFLLSPFVDGIVMVFVSFLPQIFDVVIMRVVGIFEVIGRGRMENWMVLCK